MGDCLGTPLVPSAPPLTLTRDQMEAPFLAHEFKNLEWIAYRGLGFRISRARLEQLYTASPAAFRKDFSSGFAYYYQQIALAA